MNSKAFFMQGFWNFAWNVDPSLLAPAREPPSRAPLSPPHRHCNLIMSAKTSLRPTTFNRLSVPLSLSLSPPSLSLCVASQAMLACSCIVGRRWSRGGVEPPLLRADVGCATRTSLFPFHTRGKLRAYQVRHRWASTLPLIATPRQLRYFRFRMRELQRSLVDPAVYALALNSLNHYRISSPLYAIQPLRSIPIGEPVAYDVMHLSGQKPAEAGRRGEGKARTAERAEVRGGESGGGGAVLQGAQRQKLLRRCA